MQEIKGPRLPLPEMLKRSEIADTITILRRVYLVFGLFEEEVIDQETRRLSNLSNESYKNNLPTKERQQD